jgi:CRISPR-associated endonuclease/helicase Cas3
MTPHDFDRFFEAVHKPRKPFPWQTRLAEQIAREEKWPSPIALPTSAGKTSVIDIAVFHLALQAGRVAGERTAALRIFFVIDRRIVVDEAAKHARELAQELEKSSEPIVREVAAELKRFGGPRPLVV